MRFFKAIKEVFNMNKDMEKAMKELEWVENPIYKLSVEIIALRNRVELLEQKLGL